MATQGRMCGPQPNKAAEHRSVPMHCISACRRLQSQLPTSKLEPSTPSVTAVHACIRAPGNTHLPKLHYRHAGTCSRKRRRLGICMHAGLARPNLQALPSRCFTFLGLHFKKSDPSLFSAFCSRLSRCKTRAAGSFAGCGRPAGLFVYCAISIGSIVRFRSIYLQRGLVDVLARLERFGRNLLPPPWGFCDDR
jgi:hypothetical protein